MYSYIEFYKYIYTYIYSYVVGCRNKQTYKPIYKQIMIKLLYGKICRIKIITQKILYKQKINDMSFGSKSQTNFGKDPPF